MLGAKKKAEISQAGMRAICVDPRFSEIRPKPVRLAVISIERERKGMVQREGYPRTHSR